MHLKVVTHFLHTFSHNFKTKLSTTERERVVFLLLFHKQSDNCSNDYVEVLEGSYGSTDSLKRLCGANLPFTDEYRVVRSKGSSLLVHMHTDAANQNRGFAASHQGEYKLVLNITIHGLNEISLPFLTS